MTRLPWFPFYVGDFLSATSHLSAAQRGALVSIMGAMWISADCTVPRDSEALRMITHLPQRRFKDTIKPVLDLLVLDGERLTHPQLREHYQKAIALSLRQAAIGKLGGKNRAGSARRLNGRFLPRSYDIFSNKNKESHQPETSTYTFRENNKVPISSPDGSLGLPQELPEGDPYDRLAQAIERWKLERLKQTGV
jgi:uncharacterized protein YdaU (DUF1376 family)